MSGENLTIDKPVILKKQKTFTTKTYQKVDINNLFAKLKKEVRAAITGAGNCVFRSKELESALSSNFSISAIEGINVSSKGLNSDIHASAEYRAHIIKVMAKKAVSSC